MCVIVYFFCIVVHGPFLVSVGKIKMIYHQQSKLKSKNTTKMNVNNKVVESDPQYHTAKAFCD